MSELITKQSVEALEAQAADVSGSLNVHAQAWVDASHPAPGGSPAAGGRMIIPSVTSNASGQRVGDHALSIRVGASVYRLPASESVDGTPGANCHSNCHSDCHSNCGCYGGW